MQILSYTVTVEIDDDQWDDLENEATNEIEDAVSNVLYPTLEPVRDALNTREWPHQAAITIGIE